MVIAGVVLAFLLDFLLAEPRRFHPLVGFGRWADYLELRLNKSPLNKILGIFAWCVAVIPLVVLLFMLDRLLSVNQWLSVIFSGFILYLSIGWQSLLQHARAITQPLLLGDIEKARFAVGMIVSRDTAKLNKHEVAKAATESVLENGADAIFSALFWFLLAGVPGVVLYRLSNTLDAMWGYKCERFYHFGWCAARVDDALNFIPARLTALSYALCGSTANALDCWKKQSAHWKSPNAGPVMSSGAGALNVSLGGDACYHQQVHKRPVLGMNNEECYWASAQTIKSACLLVNKSLLFWLLTVMAYQAIIDVISSLLR